MAILNSQGRWGGAGGRRVGKFGLYCTCSCSTLFQLIKTFQQNFLAAPHLLLDAILLAGQAASVQHNDGSLLFLNSCTHTRLCANPPISNGHPLRVSRGNHEADGRGRQLTSSSVLHVPFGAIVLEQSVPFPTHDLPLCTFTFAICHLLPDYIYSLDTQRVHTV